VLVGIVGYIDRFALEATCKTAILTGRRSGAKQQRTQDQDQYDAKDFPNQRSYFSMPSFHSKMLYIMPLLIVNTNDQTFFRKGLAGLRQMKSYCEAERPQ
jgi:hypothetical protein